MLGTTYLEDSDHNDADRVQLGGGRDEQVEAGGEEDGRPEEPVGWEPGCQEAPRQLGHNVTPEEGGVHVADGLGAPVELGGRGDVALVVGGVGHHLDGGDAHVASDSKRDEEAASNENCLGEPFAHAAAGALWLNIFVNLAKRRPAKRTFNIFIKVFYFVILISNSALNSNLRWISPNYKGF